MLSLVLMDLLVNVLAHNLAEPAYEADVAQLEYKLVAGEHGLVLRLRGFNHKLPVGRAHTHTPTWPLPTPTLTDPSDPTPSPAVTPADRGAPGPLLSPAGGLQHVQ